MRIRGFDWGVLGRAGWASALGEWRAPRGRLGSGAPRNSDIHAVLARPGPSWQRAAIVRELRPHFPDNPEGRNGLRPSGIPLCVGFRLRFAMPKLGAVASVASSF